MKSENSMILSIINTLQQNNTSRARAGGLEWSVKSDLWTVW